MKTSRSVNGYRSIAIASALLLAWAAKIGGAAEPESADADATAQVSHINSDNQRATGPPVHAERGYLFDHQVMAVLSRAGCNAGTCHGNLNGKGGFKLSLRGQDPWFDYLAITHDMGGRRISRTAPENSLVLRKPTAGVPHEGGQRIVPGSRSYQILKRWLASGAPPPDQAAPSVAQLDMTPSGFVVVGCNQPVGIRAHALLTDGQRLDVTELATYETSNFVAKVSRDGIVRAAKEGEVTVSVRYLSEQVSVRIAFVESPTHHDAPLTKSHPAQPDLSIKAANGNPIDRFIHTKLAQLGRPPRPPAADHVFLRRAYLDTLGQLPEAHVAQRYVADQRPDKRERLVDRLLADPRAADRWALIWSDLLRNEEKLLDRTGVSRFHEWIRESFAKARPLDQFVGQLITGRGSTYEQPASNFYRALRDPLTRGEAAARLFLGVRLQCAKCHNHPFDHWTQDDYYSWASLFARIEYEIIENKRKDKLDKSEFVGEQIVQVKDEGDVTNARTGKPAQPRFLSAAEDPPAANDSNRLEQLANWLTSYDNRQFARAQANRIWYHLMGRGLVDPVDDFRVTNPASHPELLEWLADELIRSDFDIRHLMRQIMLSETYQAGTATDSADALAVNNYAGVRPQRLAAEQLLDAQCHILDTPPKFNGYDVGVSAGQLAGVERIRRRDKKPSEDDRFLRLFGKPSRQMSCECERSNDTTLAQAFYLINGPGLQQRLNDPDNRLAQWIADDLPNTVVVEKLYWQALSRAPTETERAASVKHLATATVRLDALRDLSWALLNAKEFVYRY